jgi:hypothetical protein
MPILIVISSGMRKIWDSRLNAGPTKAEDAYIGPPSKSIRRMQRSLEIAG